MMKLFFIAVIAVIAVITVTIILSDYTTSDFDSVPLNIVLTDWAPYGLVYVAQEKGFFEKNLVDVKLTFLDESESLMLFPDGFTADGSLEVFIDMIFFDSNYIDSQLVYVIDESGPADVLVSKTNSIKELKGKTVGIWEFGGFSHIFVLKLLEDNGLNKNDVHFIEIIPSDIVRGLNDGMIDAGHTFNEKQVRLAKESGYNIIATERDTPGLIIDGIMFTTKAIELRPDDVFNFVKSYSESQDYCKLNLDECANIISLEYGWDANDTKKGLTNVDILYLDDNVELLTNPESSLYQSAKFIIKTLHKENFISFSPNVYDVINSEFVEKLTKNNEP